ncbi:mite group 2 allergen-like Ixo r 2 [Brevipalpus obovatus]|uniref:mite group 2 allergen-like Ixo r 2 n=1 Tax=Brevipalpus obovatus TaxID=246614 RepID=UPI003D9DEB3A
MFGSKVLLFAVLGFVATGVSDSKKISFKNCGGSGTINYVDVDPCDKEPCQMKEGVTYTIEGSFKPTSGADEPFLQVEVKVLGFWVKYPGIDTNPCNSYMKCPVNAGEDNVFKMKIDAIGMVHNIDTEVKISLYEDKSQKNTIICGEAPVHVV